MIETSEVLVIGAFIVLTVAVMVLSALLARLIPLLHDSVSASNLSPLYEALLPVAAKYGAAGLDEVGDALVSAAAKTKNPIDDELARYLDQRFEAVVQLIEKKTADKPPVIPDDPPEVETDNGI